MDDANGRRVVVTGLGVVSPIGCDAESFWQSLTAGRSGIATLADADDERVCAGEARGFTGHIDQFGPLESGARKAIRKALKVMNRETKMAVAAAQQSLDMSGLGGAGYNPDRIGVCFGANNVSIRPEDFAAGIHACTDSAGRFDFAQWGVHGLTQVEPLWLLTCLPNMPACYIAIFNDFRGPNNSITQREASANLALAEAFQLIAEGYADAAVTGGTGTTLLPFNRLHEALEHDMAYGFDDPTAACRPFDRRRNGAVMGEGAAAFVLETLESAEARNVPIWAEIVGTGASCAADVNFNPLGERAVANAIRAALREADAHPEQIGHVHAHGLGTPLGDIEEARAIRDVFGAHADRVPVVAAKSCTGNSGAGGGALELAASLIALQRGQLFPVRNLDELDPECPISAVTSNGVEAGESFLNINLTANGQASCVLARRAA